MAATNESAGSCVRVMLCRFQESIRLCKWWSLHASQAEKGPLRSLVAWARPIPVAVRRTADQGMLCARLFRSHLSGLAVELLAMAVRRESGRERE
eukprot:1872248-Amphidinium_carterae.1